MNLWNRCATVSSRVCLLSVDMSIEVFMNGCLVFNSLVINVINSCGINVFNNCSSMDMLDQNELILVRRLAAQSD